MPTTHTRESLRGWFGLQVAAPWVLLVIATAAYFLWTLPSAGQSYWPDAAVVTGLVVVTAAWICACHTLPALKPAFPRISTLIYFIGLLALCVALMSYAEVFVIVTVSAFFVAYQLSPWPVGVLGVLATSVAINGMSSGMWQDQTPESAVMFVLIVLLQTAAIGVGIPIMARSEMEERKREELVAQLEDALHENAGLHAQLVVQARESGVLDERQRLAGEIHDTIAQGLAGIITQLQAAEQTGTLSSDATEHTDRALALARESLTEARRSVSALTPGELGVAHLPEALTTLVERWSADHEVTASMEITGTPIPLSPAIDVSLFRVVQEALRNVGKHAGASRVGVTLSYSGPEVLLDVRDNGRGFDETDGTGFGLTSMRQRIRGIGGHVEIQSAPGDGTSLSARVPAIGPGDGVEDRASDSEKGHQR